jgi:DNA-binding MarR family transcriptional regulator
MASTSYQAADVNSESTGRLFLLAYRDFQIRCVPMLEERGHGKLTAAHITALTHIDTEGARLVNLADRANMTKQSMGDLIQELEVAGYVARADDPKDKRASIITLTEQGKRFFVDAQVITQEIDKAYAAIIGEKGMSQLRGLLIEILQQGLNVNL